MQTIEGDLGDPADRARMLASLAENGDRGGVIQRDASLTGLGFSFSTSSGDVRDYRLSPEAFELFVGFLLVDGVNIADRLVRKSDVN